MAKRAYKLDGARQLMRTLRKMGIKKSAIVKVLRPHANEIRDEARRLAPKDTGTLAKYIRTKSLSGKTATVVVRPQYSRKRKKDGNTESIAAAPHAHLVEFGTIPNRPAVKGGGFRYVTLGGRKVKITHTGHMRAQPFMRPAADKLLPKIQKKLRPELWGLVKAQARKARSGGR